MHLPVMGNDDFEPFAQSGWEKCPDWQGDPLWGAAVSVDGALQAGSRQTPRDCMTPSHGAGVGGPVDVSCCGAAEAHPASAAFHQEQGRGGSKDLDNMKSDRMRTVQLNVCDSEEVGRAVDYVTSSLKDPETGGERERAGGWSRNRRREGRAISLPSEPVPVPTQGQRLARVLPA